MSIRSFSALAASSSSSKIIQQSEKKTHEGTEKACILRQLAVSMSLCTLLSLSTSLCVVLLYTHRSLRSLAHTTAHSDSYIDETRRETLLYISTDTHIILMMKKAAAKKYTNQQVALARRERANERTNEKKNENNKNKV